ncbi:MAG: fumarylacetoacetate hydrolase family protein [Gammaproteobacteria bacterium]|nr:fumarylacetoacetate hydrolase family protein [Gammaproteobacteria bacterium]
MKLLRYGPPGQEKPGMLDFEGRIRDLSGKIKDIAGDALSPASLAKLAALDAAKLPLVRGNPRIGPCVGGVSKLVCVGLNYSDHAAETGAKIPSEPILFQKATSCIIGPNDEVMLPRGSKKTDWEVELGVVIGTTARYVPIEKSLDYVAGYCVFNDVSEREYQIERGGQWTKGKSADTFGPMGPWFVTKEEVPDPQNLEMFLDVSGVRRQTGNTRTMIFGVQHLVSYISQFMTLLPGDVIPTGTPPGVGLGMKPPQFLKAGDVMHLGITGLGEQHQRVVEFRLAAAETRVTAPAGG